MAKKTVPAKEAAKPVEKAEKVEVKTFQQTPDTGREVVAKGIEKPVEVTKEQVVEVTKKQPVEVTKKQPVEATKKQPVEATKEQVEKISSGAFKAYGDFAALGQETLEAYVRSGTVFAKGFESLNKELMTFARDTFDSNVKTAQALFGAKTLREAIDLQSEYSRTSLDNVLSESAKLTEMSVQMANEAIQPIQTRATVAFEKIIKPIAA